MTTPIEARFQNWLADGDTVIGIFRNQDMSHPLLGHRIAMPFDKAAMDKCVIGKNRAPDHPAIGLGWRYLLEAKCVDIESALDFFKGEEVDIHDSVDASPSGLNGVPQ